MTPEVVVSIQIEAYNRRDLEAFLATYAHDVRIIETDGSKPPLIGIEALRERFEIKTFRIEGLHAEIRSRMVIGNKVIDHEITTWTGMPHPNECIAVYEVVNDLITACWFYDPSQRTAFTDA